MELHYVKNDYLNYIYEKCDREVLYSHATSSDRGRANVLVLRTEYKGQYVDFAIPYKGEITNNDERLSSVLTAIKKNAKSQNGGFVISKLMPVDVSVLNALPIENDDFKRIQKEISQKEPELIAKTKEHLKSLENGKTIKFATNVDKQLQFLNARAELLNQGISQEQIYNSSFECNVLRAETFRSKENQVSKLEIKPKVKGLEIE